ADQRRIHYPDHERFLRGSTRERECSGLVVVLVLENPDRFAIRLTEQISCSTSVSLRSRHPNAPRTIPKFGIWAKEGARRTLSRTSDLFANQWEHHDLELVVRGTERNQHYAFWIQLM